jgi:hypothetical protein
MPQGSTKQLISYRYSNSVHHARQSRVRHVLGFHCRHALSRRWFAPPVTITSAGVSNAQSNTVTIAGPTHHTANMTSTQPSTSDNPPASLLPLHRQQQEYVFMPSSPLLHRVSTPSINSESGTGDAHHDDSLPSMLNLAPTSMLNSQGILDLLLTEI